MRKFLLIAAAVLLPVMMQAQVKLLRHPTYSKGKVAFSYLGDIWIASENGGDILRLTDNRARDVYPRFSPDGQWIAFSSNRAGNDDVYVIAASGGRPRQLTFHSAPDTVVGWTPDGKQIVFASARGNGAFPTVTTLWEVPAAGGIETPIETDWGSNGSFSPDASKLAFTRHPAPWSRKHYRGSYAADLWVADLAAKKFTRLGDPDYKGNRLWPMYGNNGEIYYVSNATAGEKNIKFGGPEVMQSVNNIWKISDKGGKETQVTHHGDGNLFFPTISADGKTIVYEDNFGIWKLDTASGKSSEIRIDIKSDRKDNDTELVTMTNEASGFSLSPTNKRAAIIAHGEVFTIATDRGEPQRVTETPAREQNPRWSPNGKWIAFVSDRTGREEVFISDELGKTVKKLSDSDCDKTAIVWAPDSKSLLYTGSDHKLRKVDVDSGATDVVATSDVANIEGPQFSPDGKWISYAKDDKQLNSRVWIKELATGQEHQVGGDGFLLARSAKWTPDGKKLVFLGGYGAPGMASLNRTTLQLFSVALTPFDKDPNDRDINTEAQAEAAAAETSAAGRGGRGAAVGVAANVQVKIVWDGLDRRIKELTHAGSVGAAYPSPDSRLYLFTAQGDGTGGGGGMYTINEDGTGLTPLNTTVAAAGGARGRGGRGGGGGGGEPQWARDGRSIYFMQGGGLYTLAVGAPAANSAPADTAAAAGGGRGRGGRGGGGGGTAAAPAAAGAGPRPINFTVRMEVDIAAERKEVFVEAWRTMKNRFYDPAMHGVNWAAAKDKYEPMLGNVADQDELHDLIMEMIGDMNASHTGITGGAEPGEASTSEPVQTRYPGFNMEPDSSGFYKVSYLYKKGPADHDYLKIAVGNYILAVNGKELKSGDNYWKLFNILPGAKFEFLVNSKPTVDGAWAIDVDPLTAAAQGNLEYDLWVDSRKQTVSKLSGGEIGYLHIKAMDAPSFEKFQRELLENLDKKALIIDERFNGGGGIDQELLEILNQRRKFETYRSRDSVEVPRPILAFFGPMAVVQNERSASDAEMFPEGFRALGLGKVIGVPTSGQVIGTGSFTLLDGSALRTPGAGVFGAKGQDMENYGVPPDVEVDNTPLDFLAGHDRQVEKAVEVLKGEIK